MGIMCQEDTHFAKTMNENVLVRVALSTDIAMSIEWCMGSTNQRIVITTGDTSQIILLEPNTKTDTEIIQFIETHYIDLKRQFDSMDFKKRYKVVSCFSWRVKEFIESK